MNKGVSIILTILTFCFFIYMINSIFKFLDISMSKYINYLLWIIVITIFYFILPKKVGKMF